MKSIIKFLFLTGIAGVFFASCSKVDKLPFNKNGNVPVLTASTTTITSNPGDSASVALTLNWTNPKYATDSNTEKYIIEFDSSGRNFQHEVTTTVSGALTASFTAKQLNDILAGFGFAPNQPFNIDVRVTSSYANNNEQYTSNVLTIAMTPYIVPITLIPSSTNPLVLQISDAANTAVSFSWTPSQYGSATIFYALQIDTLEGAPQIIKLGNALQTDLTVSDLNNYAILAGVAANTSNNVEFKIVGYLDANYTTPSVFSNVVTINITTYLPFLYLYVPGGYQGWSPSSAPALGATVPNLNSFEGYINVPASTQDFGFKITNAPDWNHIAYGAGGTAGTLSPTGGNLTWAAAGYYRLQADPSALTWSATATTWGILGDATAIGWGSSTPMTYDETSNIWYINNLALTVGDVKFRANDTWDINLGGDINNLTYNSPNNIHISVAGNYNVVLDLSHPLKYTATFTKL